MVVIDYICTPFELNPYDTWLLNEWPLDVVDLNEDMEVDPGEENPTISEQSEASERSVPICHQCGAVQGQDDNPEDNSVGYRIQEDSSIQECPLCLCHPCVTGDTNKQMWWEDKTYPASRSNSRIRKNHYQRFWVMLLYRGAWEKELYKQKNGNCP